GMGADDRRGRPQLLSVVDRLRTRHGHPVGRPRLQLPRRRSARPPRSADAVMAEALLEVRSLEVTSPTAGRALQAIRGRRFPVAPGETLGVVGESGCGKSVTMLAMMGLLAPHVRVRGSIRFRGEELVGRPQKDLAKLRGARIGMIFQDPMTALNPVLTVGAQI